MVTKRPFRFLPGEGAYTQRGLLRDCEIFEPAFEALQDARQISGASRPGHSSTIIKESSEELYKHY